MLLWLGIAFLLSTLVGLGILAFTSIRRSDRLLVSGVLGYLFLQVIFIGIFLVANRNVDLAFYSTLGISAFIFLGALFWRRSQFYFTKQDVLTSLMVLLLAFSCIGIAGYNSFISDPAEYWGTGTPDAFDGIFGAQYYFTGTKAFEGYLWGVDASQAELIMGANWRELRQNDYLYSPIAIQYSSVAFWTYLTGSHFSFKPVYIQALLNLIFMFCGLYLLGQLLLGRRVAGVCLGIGGVLSHLYVFTYTSLHIGSLMFGAAIPVLLYFWLQGDGGERRKLWPLILIATLFIAGSYLHPLVFFVAPAALLMLRQDPRISVLIKNKWAWGATGLVFMAALYLALPYLTDVQEFAASRYRAWGVSFTSEMFLIYWGFTDVSGYFWGDNIFAPSWLKSTLLSLAIALSIFSVVGLVWLAKRYQYFGYFLVPYFSFFALIFFLGDSYFFYKFLYTTQFVFILGLVAGSTQIQSSIVKKILIPVLGVFLLACNLSLIVKNNKSLQGYDINMHPEKFQSFLKFDRDLLSDIFVDVPKRSHKQLITTYAQRERITTSLFMDMRHAKKVLLFKATPDISHRQTYLGKNVKILAEDENFLLVEKPEQYVHVSSFWDVEVTDPQNISFLDRPFRWVSGKKNSRVLLRGNAKENYLRLCYQVGPGVDYRASQVIIKNEISSADEGVASEFTAVGAGCHYHPIPPGNFMVGIYFPTQGKNFLPYDDRDLNFRIAEVGLVNEVYDPAALHFLNPLRARDSQTSFFYGNGWLPNQIGQMLSLGKSEMVYKPMSSENRTPKWKGHLRPGYNLSEAMDVLITDGIDYQDKLSFVGQPIEKEQNFPPLNGRNLVVLKYSCDPKYLKANISDDPRPVCFISDSPLYDQNF